jgi:hypothetical protein
MTTKQHTTKRKLDQPKPPAPTATTATPKRATPAQPTTTTVVRAKAKARFIPPPVEHTDPSEQSLEELSADMMRAVRLIERAHAHRSRRQRLLAFLNPFSRRDR